MPVLGMTESLDAQIRNEQQRIQRDITERNARFFEDEADKLDGWADDLKVGLEREIKEVDRQIKEARRAAASVNTVIDAALARQGLSRLDIYVTQTLHIVPRKRSERISPAAIRRSFDEVTRFELQGRRVIAPGDIAAGQCARHSIEHIAVCHPSRRGYSNEKNATEIAEAIAALGFGRAVKEFRTERDR
jgi:hypothetical protein